MNEHLVMHIDLNAFFASIEQRDHPEYQGRPLVVGAKPDRRGVVATCSYEARRYGVHSAMPISEAAVHFHMLFLDGVYTTNHTLG
jgi:DNA polymerase-4